MIKLLILLYVVSYAACNEKDWWKFTEIYEIYISSFKDSNGDGVGDLKGITSKLDHFVNLEMDSIWITPFYDSPKIDMGYDIRNYTAVDPVFGTLADFEELSREAKNRGIKVIMDFVINHSSDEHIWFQKSIDKIKPYDDYYVWKDAKGYDKNNKPIPPNNWMSWFDGSAWEWNTKRKQFYLHQFGRKQPDLNLRNAAVIKELKEVLIFWFDKGVSGMRFDAAAYYIEDAELRDESLLDENNENKVPTRADYTETHTKNLPESYEVIHEFRVFIDEINKKRGGNQRIIVVEDYANLSSTIAYYGTENHPVAHYPFNFDFARASDYFTSESLHKLIMTWLESVPKHGVPTWNAENHDRSRFGSRFVKEYSRIINIIIMLLPGVPSIYYGQEICMVDGVVRLDQEKDYVNLPGTTHTRDLARTPMQWDGTLNSGFTSSAKTWLPVHPSFWRLNVELLKNTEKSCYNIFKDLSRLRKTITCKYGKYTGYKLSTRVYAFTRTLKDHDTYVAVMNLGNEYEMVNLHAQIPKLKVFLRVLVATENSGYSKGSVVKVKSKSPNVFTLKPFSAIVFLNGQHPETNKTQINKPKNDQNSTNSQQMFATSVSPNMNIH